MITLLASLLISVMVLLWGITLATLVAQEIAKDKSREYGELMKWLTDSDRAWIKRQTGFATTVGQDQQTI